MKDMNKVLSQEEIETLLTSDSTGREDASGGGENRRKVTLYDFKHPNLISKEQMRLLEHVHEGLVRNFSVYLSAQLRMIVDMRLLAVDQIMYSEFVMTITSPGAIYIGDLDEPHSQLILEISPQLAVFIVERLFGGQGSFISTIRPVSLIEQRIVRRVIDRMAVEISKNWEPIKRFNCSFVRFESNPEFVQIVPASEPVVVVSMEVNIHGNTTMINLCYPYMWISNVMSPLEIQEKILFGTPNITETERRLVNANLENTTLPVRAILGKSRITVRDFIEMREGDVIRLDAKVNEPRPVYVRNRCLYAATVGKRGGNYAFRIGNLVNGDDNGSI